MVSSKHQASLEKNQLTEQPFPFVSVCKVVSCKQTSVRSSLYKAQHYKKILQLFVRSRSAPIYLSDADILQAFLYVWK